MRLLFIISLLVLSFSCNDPKQEDRPIIPEDSSVSKSSVLDGGSMYTTDLKIEKDSAGSMHKINKEAYLKQEALREKLIGWWKLIYSKMPVKLINNSGYYEKFTLNIRPDGNAIFYLENLPDSTLKYSYSMNIDAISFSRGCMVGADCAISFDSTGRMKLVLDKSIGDTLVFERVMEFK